MVPPRQQSACKHRRRSQYAGCTLRQQPALDSAGKHRSAISAADEHRVRAVSLLLLKGTSRPVGIDSQLLISLCVDTAQRILILGHVL